MKYLSNSILKHGLGSKVLKHLVLLGEGLRLMHSGSDIKFVWMPLSKEAFGIDFTYNDLICYDAYGRRSREQYIEICDIWDNMLGYKGEKYKDYMCNDVNLCTFPDVSIDSYQNTFNYRKEILNLLSLPPKVLTDKIEVAVHIRRGDVNQTTYPDRWISDEKYLEILSVIKNTLGDMCNITIYTQTASFDFKKYTSYNIVYDNQTKDHEVWLKFVHADILVMGKSAYSYSAGLINSGSVVYIDSFHTKVNEWVTIGNLRVSLKNRFEN
jgi:hypothetical protein